MGGPRPPMNGGFGFKIPPTGGAFGDFFGMPPGGMMGKSELILAHVALFSILTGLECNTKIDFLISPPKHMLWVLKRTVSMLR